MLRKSLTFTEETSRIIGKTRGITRNINFLTRIFGGVSTSKQVLAYKSHIRPILEFGIPVWIMSSNKNKKRLAAVKSKALARAAGADRVGYMLRKADKIIALSS